MKNLQLFIIYLIIGISTRTIFHIAPNIEFLTAISFGSALFFKNKFLKFATPILILIITDLIIGNTSIFLFTWSAFLFSFIFSKNISKDSLNRIIVESEVHGILFVIFFFLWTNLGVVLTSDMYEKSLFGLFESYVNALPFLANQILGNVFIIPVIVGFSFLFTEEFHIESGQQFSTKS